jgi:hypothetical protein
LLNARTKVGISSCCCSSCSMLAVPPHPNSPPTPSLSVASRTRGRQKARCCSGLLCFMGSDRHLVPRPLTRRAPGTDGKAGL